MIDTNGTWVTEFVILGFYGMKNMKLLLFGMFLLIYIITVAGNIVIVSIVFNDIQLHTPMYFFLSNLSFLEILYTTNIIPIILSNIITTRHTMSLIGCIAQLYFFGSLGSTECFLLGVMAYDRYVAICKPLYYSKLMNTRTSIVMALGSWGTGFIATFAAIILVSQLHFCGPNMINHFFCDLRPVLRLSCINARTIDTVAWTFASTILLGSCFLTLASYIRIIMTLLRIPTSKGRQRAYSTCTAHLTVVVIFYGAMISMYVSPNNEESAEFNKVSSLLYTVVTPFMNPFIYALRNKDVKQALHKSIARLCQQY